MLLLVTDYGHRHLARASKMVKLSRESARRPEQVLSLKYLLPDTQEQLVAVRRRLEEADLMFVKIEEISDVTLASFWTLDACQTDKINDKSATNCDRFVKIC